MKNVISQASNPSKNSRSKGGKAGVKPGKKPQKKGAPASRTRRPNTPGGGAAADKQRARKGPYGRLNGGAQRKTGAGNKPARTGEGGNYEIGGWEKQDYAPKQPDADKKVVIRYKEKKRRTLIK